MQGIFVQQNDGRFKNIWRKVWSKSGKDFSNLSSVVQITAL